MGVSQTSLKTISMDKMAAEDFSPLSLLEAIFPDKDRILLMEQLRQCNNNAQLAADKLFELNSKKKPKGSSPKVFPQAPPPTAAPSSSQWPSIATGSSVYTPPPPPGLGPSGWGLVPAATSTVSIKRLIIIRGLPGSGKSTLAKELVGENGIICSTDDFFVENGRYIFDPTKLSINHERNQAKAAQAMREGRTPVIIDNTNTTAWEMKAYVTMALELRYSVEFKEPNTSWKFDASELERRNTHSVNRESIERMLERYQHNMTVDIVLASDKPPSRSNSDSRYHSNSYRGSGYRGSGYRGCGYHGGGHHGIGHYGGGFYGGRGHGGPSVSSPPRSHTGWNSRTHTHSTQTHTHTSPPQPRSGWGHRTHSYTSPSQTRTDRTHTHTSPYTDTRTQTHTDRTHTHTSPPKPHTQTTRTDTDSTTVYKDGAGGGEGGSASKDILDFSPPFSPPYNTTDTVTNKDTTTTAVATGRSTDSDTLKSSLLNIISRGDTTDSSSSFSYPLLIRKDDKTVTLDSSPVPPATSDQVGNGQWPVLTPSSSPQKPPETNRGGETTPTLEPYVGASKTSITPSLGLMGGATTSDLPSEPKPDTYGDLTIEMGMAETNAGGVAGSDGGSEEQKEESDLEFLQECFQDTPISMLQALYRRASSNLSATVDLVLHIPIPQPTFTMELLDEEEDEWMEFENKDDSPSTIPTSSMDSTLFVDATIKEEKMIVDDSEEDKEGMGVVEVGGVTMEEEEDVEKGYDIMKDLGLTKEEYERALGEQLKIERGRKGRGRGAEEGDPNATTAKKGIGTGTKMKGTRHESMESARTRPEVPGTRSRESSSSSTGEGGGGGDWDDTNLMLRLTSSLAKQLQSIFGQVPSHLLRDGIVKDEDLIVLLNERTAKGLYEKWIDTLEAKDIEYRYTQGKGAAAASSSPAKNSKDKENRSPVDRHTDWHGTMTSSQPVVTNLHRIMDEQFAEQLGQKEVDDFVAKKMRDDTSVYSNVYQLYKTYPQLSRSVINWQYYKSKFDLTAAQASLYSIAVRMKPRTAASVKANSKSATVSRTDAAVIKQSIGEEEENIDLDYSDLRAEAAVHAQLRAEAFQKAARARAGKQGEVAMHYAKQGHMHTEKMNEANRRAAEMTYRMKNKGRDRNTVDLHCLHVKEALQVLEERLVEPHSKGQQLFVITGRGLHSRGPPKLKPAVLSRLGRGEGKWMFEVVNAGLIKITFQ